jgi:hypothetical protein
MENSIFFRVPYHPPNPKRRLLTWLLARKHQSEREKPVPILQLLNSCNSCNSFPQ